MKRIYLDHAAATPLDSRVRRELLTCMDVSGNPASIHSSGRDAKDILDAARSRIGTILHCRPEELVFTGSGTEANNLALFGIARANKDHGRHVIISNIEHHSVLRPAQALTQEGFEVTEVPVQPSGIIDPGDVKRALRPDTILASIIYANNEIGAIQQIRQIAKIIADFRKAIQLYGSKAIQLVFHTDACQAAGFLDINVQNLGVDLMTINGAKIYGPKSTGALFVRRGVRIAPMILGGDQERGLRAGTQNPALFVGFAKALELADASKGKESKRLVMLRDRFIERVLKEIPNSHLNGDPTLRLPNNINISFEGIDGEMLMLALDLKGIEVSTGAACTVTSTEPSHVLQALHATRYTLHDSGNIRLTLGRSTTKKDLEYTLEVLKKEVARLRNL